MGKPVQIVITKKSPATWKVSVMDEKTTLNTYTLKEDFVAATVRRVIKQMEVTKSV